ncbi:MAG: hypothetical protein WAX14_21405 [Rhodococcus sp. (in: high G+C Gram-positive bacteria)]|uniref:COG4315 family predicted lipoprotein n=1 Tax=Rhodococcus sp. TaxID=1831 RepID=UPI003BB5CA53
MNRLVRAAAPAAFAAVLVLAGCGDGDTDTDTDTDSGAYDHGTMHTTESAPTTQAEAAGAALAVAGSELGDIVVDGRGMTVYIYDLDTPGSGTSACTGPCLTEWPPVTADTSSPQVAGVGGQIGTIPGPDGTQQLTVNGWPLYFYVDDTTPGEVDGQGEGGVWWVLDSAGQKVTTEN